jgi:hypothetical protein
MQVDPLAENSISMTAYHYAAGNPIRNIDPDGMDWVDNNPQGGKSVVNYKGVDNMRSNFETVTIKGDLGGAAIRLAAQGLSGIGAMPCVACETDKAKVGDTYGDKPTTIHQRYREYNYSEKSEKWNEKAIFQSYGGIYGQTNAEPSAGVALGTAGPKLIHDVAMYYATGAAMGGLIKGVGIAFTFWGRTRIVNEGIYQFTAASGKTYVGQSGDIAARIQQHIASGKLLPNTPVKITEVLGGKTAREIAEQLRINSLGGIIQNGVKVLENIRNPIGKARQYLLP